MFKNAQWIGKKLFVSIGMSTHVHTIRGMYYALLNDKHATDFFNLALCAEYVIYNNNVLEWFVLFEEISGVLFLSMLHLAIIC